MNDELDKILETINNTSYFDKYTEFNLDNHIDMSIGRMQQLILKLNNCPNMKAFYNSVTTNCDMIGVIDTDGTRIIDFEDNYYTLMNKGIDRQTNKLITNN
jgi:hypothetical protein